MRSSTRVERVTAVLLDDLLRDVDRVAATGVEGDVQVDVDTFALRRLGVRGPTEEVGR